MAHGSTDGATESAENVSLSLSLGKKKSSSTIAAFLVAEKISYPVSDRIDQRIEWDRREMLVKNYFQLDLCV